MLERERWSDEEMEGGRQRVKEGIRDGWIEKGVVN